MSDRSSLLQFKKIGRKKIVCHSLTLINEFLLNTKIALLDVSLSHSEQMKTKKKKN